MIKIVFIVTCEYADFKFPTPMTVFIFSSKYYDTVSSRKFRFRSQWWFGFGGCLNNQFFCEILIVFLVKKYDVLSA